MNNTYPTPKPRVRVRLKVAASNDAPEFGATREQYEERIFRAAMCFNVVRFGTHNGSEIATTNSYPKALALAHGNPRALIYVVASDGSAFCMPSKDYLKYAEIHLGMSKLGEQNAPG